MQKKRILIISLTGITNEPRVDRQIQFLKDQYSLTVVGYGPPRIQGVESFLIPPPKRYGVVSPIIRTYYLLLTALYHRHLMLRRFEKFYWERPHIQWMLDKIKGDEFDLIIAHDIHHTLPLALHLAHGKRKVLVDAHEYSPREFDDVWWWRLLFQKYTDYLCARYLPQVDAATTVCQGLAEEYERNYGIPFTIITSAPYYEELIPQPVRNERIRMIHHGGVHPSRGTHNMIRLMNFLDKRFSLDLMVVNRNSFYTNKLRKMAQHNPRIRFRDPVPMVDIAKTINAYDIGLCIRLPKAYNYYMSLPNKFFEFVQARLATAIWPLPEMARIVREYGCGVIAEEFTLEAMAEKLNKLTTEEIWHYKQQSHKAARMLSAEANRQILLDLVETLIGT